ncbi:hypothetical protein [Flexistipes sp.]|nr:hypothetical protein [Flexistipes sp.]
MIIINYNIAMSSTVKINLHLTYRLKSMLNLLLNFALDVVLNRTAS